MATFLPKNTEHFGMQPFTHTNNKHEHTFSHPPMRFVPSWNINKSHLFFFALNFLQYYGFHPSCISHLPHMTTATLYRLLLASFAIFFLTSTVYESLRLQLVCPVSFILNLKIALHDTTNLTTKLWKEFLHFKKATHKLMLLSINDTKDYSICTIVMHWLLVKNKSHHYKVIKKQFTKLLVYPCISVQKNCFPWILCSFHGRLIHESTTESSKEILHAPLMKF